MLAQHIITKPVFDALFDDFTFSEKNVSDVMEGIIVLADEASARKLSLEKFMRQSDPGCRIDTAAGKQTVIKELYDKFFSSAFTKMSQSLGIVYTPVEVVDFIVHSVEDALQEHFGAGLNSHDVQVLDPFTGTGTFPCPTPAIAIIEDKNLDLVLQGTSPRERTGRCYYVAAVNIEAVYHEFRKDADYTPIPGIVD